MSQRWRWSLLSQAISMAELVRLLNLRMTDLATNLSNVVTGVYGTSTFADADTTPSVVGWRFWMASNTAPTNITRFDAGSPGSEIIVWATTANTTFVHSATLRMKSGANVTMSATDVRRFATVDGVAWREV